MPQNAPSRKNFAPVPGSTRDRLARAVRSARAGEGLTQADLAEKAGVGRNRVSDIESGEADPRLSTIEKVTDALGLSLTLIGGDAVVAASST